MSWRLLVVIAMVALIFYATVARAAAVRGGVPRVRVHRGPAPRGRLPGALAAARAGHGAGASSAGIVFFLGLLTYVGYSIANQWTDLTEQFSDGIGQITDFLENGPLPFSITNDQIAEWISNGQKWVQDHAGDLAGQAAAGAGSVVEVFTALALAIFCTVFFLARGREMWTWFLNQLPSRVRDSWKTAGGAGWYTFSGYTRGTVIIAVTDGMLAFILLSILRVPLSAPLAVLVFIGAFIPLIGAPLAMVIAMIVALAANGLLSAAIVGIGIALIGQFEGHILQPIVMGKQVSIHPVVIALAVTAGTLTAGILGAVISVPLVAVCWAIFSRLRTLDPPMEEDESDDDVEPVDERRGDRRRRGRQAALSLTGSPATPT